MYLNLLSVLKDLDSTLSHACLQFIVQNNRENGS
jgi:hypothetical protein